MSDRWNKLRDQFKTKNIDLDAEFEKFLNESMSDESSLGSPRMKTPDLKAKPRGQMPWWAEEEDDDDRKKTEAVRQSWLKPKTSKLGEGKPELETTNNDTTAAVATPEAHPDKSGGTAMSRGSYIDTSALSMSKDSLEEGYSLAKSMEKKKPSHEEILKRLGSEDFEDTLSHSDEPKTGATTSQSSPVPQSFSAKHTSMGLDTMNEVADKERFFQDMEGGSSSVDYNKKLKEISTSESADVQNQFDNEHLQATGAELGDSIFNVTGTSDQRDKAVEEVENDKLGGEDYSDNFEEGEEEEEEEEEGEGDDEHPDDNDTEQPARPSAPEPAEVAKPSMLSKVSLMESLDSTLETKRPAAALNLLSQQNKPQVGVSSEGSKQSPTSKNERQASLLRTGPDYEASGSTRDIHELQAALQAAQLTVTGTGSKYSGNFDLPSSEAAKQSTDQPDERQIVIEKNQQGETRSRGFDLQPVVVTDDWVSTKDGGVIPSEEKLSSLNEEGGFGLKPVRAKDDRKAGIESSVESSDGGTRVGTVSGTGEQRGLDLAPALGGYTEEGRGFDMQPVDDAAGFSLQPSPQARGFDLLSAVAASPGVTEGGRGFDLQPEKEGRSFNLQPSSKARGLDFSPVASSSYGNTQDGRGYDLQPADERSGFSLQPVVNLLRAEKEVQEDDDDDDTPLPESLQSIKSIARARKGAGGNSLKKSTETSMSGKKASKFSKEKPGKKTAVVEKSQHKKEKGKASGSYADKSSLFKPSPSSGPSWSPTPTMRSSKTKTKKSFGASKKLLVESPAASKPTNTSPSAKELAASVESFANYLKHIVRPGNEDTEPPPARWSEDEPAKSVSRTSFRRLSDEHRLSRERALQAEVENWQLAWKDEKKRNDKLIADMASREKEWSRREERCRLEYESQIHELKQELFVMQSKFNETEKEADLRKRVAAGGRLEVASEEEMKRLEKEVREQEQLLTGYQQENERLYKELKQIQAKEKASEARMFSENQKLASELAILKEKIERRESGGPGPDLPAQGSATLGADKISQLTVEVRSLRRRVSEVQDEADELRRAKQELETRIRGIENERDAAVKQSSQVLGSNTREIAELESRHAAEVERLRTKLKWYAETQALLDRDAITLKKKEEEISELKETVVRLQAQHGQTVAEKKQRGVERANDARRIQDLERQVREMEEIIKRRYPNSLPALIYAAASAPGQAQPLTTESPRKQSTTYAFLENRVKKLEAELEDKDEEASKRIRCVEQKYNALRLEYEDRVKDLEQDLQRANERNEKTVRSNTRTKIFEEELQRAREANDEKVKLLQTEIEVLQDALSKATTAEGGKATRRKRLELEKRETDDVSLAIQPLQEKLEKKELELEDLRQTCNRLQREREQMLATEGHLVDRYTSPKPDPLVDDLTLENKRLKEQVSHMSLDMDQQRVRYQASLAESERSTRLAREEAADQLASIQAQHKRELDQLKAGFAAEHVSSKIAELKSQLAGQEIVIQRLKVKMADTTVNAETIAAAKVREESLQQQVAQLQTDLRRAKKMFTPEMNHFDSLETKIVALEQKHSQREVDLQRVIEKTHLTAKIDKEETEARWRQVVRQKNREIEKFRFELDGILEVLSELKRQGVVIPFRHGEGFAP